MKRDALPSRYSIVYDYHYDSFIRESIGEWVGHMHVDRLAISGGWGEGTVGGIPRNDTLARFCGNSCVVGWQSCSSAR